MGKGENGDDMKFLNRNNLMIKGDDSLILIDIKNRKIVNEFKYDFYLDFDNICCLNEKTFLYYKYIRKKKKYFLYQFKLEDEKTIKLKEEREMDMDADLVKKYQGNKIIINTYKEKKLIIYG